MVSEAEDAPRQARLQDHQASRVFAAVVIAVPLPAALIRDKRRLSQKAPPVEGQEHHRQLRPGTLRR